MRIVVSGLTDFDNVLFHREVGVKDGDGKQSESKQGVEKRVTLMLSSLTDCFTSIIVCFLW